jgi:hypothetical protein
MAHPTARRFRIAGMHRRLGVPPTRRVGGQSSPIYRVTQCLRDGHTAEVAGYQIATTVSAWLAELGADSPLVDDLARAIRVGDWTSAHAIGDYLSIDVTVAA